MSRATIINGAYSAINTNWLASNGFAWDMVKTEQLARSFDEVSASQKPWCGVYPGVETYEYMPSNRMACNLELIVLIHVDEKTLSARITKIEQAIDGIVKALRQEVLCAYGAISTTLTSIDTDEGDPGAYNQGSLVARLTVRYLRDEPTS